MFSGIGHVCPLSNVKLCVFDRLEDHNLKQRLGAGVCVTVNSDDPAYFGGYIGRNLCVTARALELDRKEIEQLARNAVTASFLDAAGKQRLHADIDRWRAGPDPEA